MAQMCDDLVKNDINDKKTDDVKSYRDPHDAAARKSCLKAVDAVVGTVAALTVLVGVLTAGAGGAALAIPVAFILTNLGKVATSDIEQTPNRNHAMQRAAIANDARSPRMKMPALEERYLPGSVHSKRIA